ncbi:MAG: EAL domain-containing protein [Porticoccaceae bacterium]
MTVANLPALLQNAALLLAMVVVYDIATRRQPLDNLAGQLSAGALIGLIGAAIIHTSFPFESGIVFDTRSVLMAVCGLFLGLVPTLVAIAVTVVFRLAEGGAALTGILVILSSAAIGLAWRRWRKGSLGDIGFTELYRCGLAVHLAMLALMFTLPGEDTPWRVLSAIGLPVMLIHPLATAALGAIFANRLQREALKQSLEQERHLLQLLFASLPDLVWLKDPAGRYQACNPRLGALFGAAPERIIGNTDHDFVDKATADHFRHCDRLVMESRQPLTYEEWVTFASDGHRELLETTKIPLFDTGGNISGVLGMGHDISARKHVEQQLRQLAQAVEQSTESIVITNTAGDIEYVNDAFVASSGYDRDEVRGRNSRLLQSGKTPPEYHAALWANLAAGRSWRGEFHNRRKNGEEYIESAIISPIRQPDGTITHYLAVKQDITHQKAAQARIEHLAHYDELTALPNRALLTERLQTLLALSQRQRHQGALIIVNLDHFKTVNEARGIAFGDAILQLAGARLQSLAGDGDTVARLSADEFAVLLPDLSPHRAGDTGQHAEATAENIHAAFQRPLEIDGETVTLSVSMGITLFPEAPEESAEDVISRADTALHRAKAAGGNHSAFFETAMGVQAKARYGLEKDLRAGLKDGQLAVYLQSQVDRDGQVVAAEALLRWQHPERGLVPPSLFIPIAEQSDLIVELGAWVLEEVCRLIAAQQEQGRRLRIAVNLSPRQFRKAGFVPWLKNLLATTGADPGHLTLEVTEGLMIDNMDMVVGKMHDIAALGVRFSVDDFGTGYSSLAYLKRLPIREVKIDKSFVQDLPDDRDDAVLVDTILAIARHLNLAVVAEGVETPAQADFLNARGNVIHQGFLFARPRPAGEWLDSWIAGDREG